MAVGSGERRTTTVSGVPPSPKGLPLLGSALDLKRDVLGTMLDAMLHHGDVVRFVIGPPGLRTIAYGFFHPDGVQHVLAGGSNRYVKGGPVWEEVAALLGNGLLTSEGEVWKRQKRLVQPLFTHRRVGTYAGMMAEEGAALVERWKPAAQEGGTVDLAADMTRVALRMVGRALFGSDVDYMIPVLKDAVPFLSERAIQRGLSPVRIPRTWPTPGNRRAAHDQAAIYAIVDEIIARRKAAGGSQEDLVSLLLAAQDPEGGHGLDDDEVRDQALIFLMAGHETTATSMTFALHLLGHHPETQERVHAELDDVLQGRPPDAGDLAALPYTTMAVKEAMRLYPAAHSTGRIAVEDDEVNGYRIPAGCAAVVSMWATHRHPRFWDEPERYDPDRFTAERELARHRYAYFPFGGGPRACIGQHFAMQEAVAVTAAVMQSYRVTTSSGPVPLFTGITLRPRSAMPARIEPRRPGG